MIADGITYGHVLLSDWLFLIAAVLFVVAAVLAATASGAVEPPRRPSNGRYVTPLALVALALVALAWMVL